MISTDGTITRILEDANGDAVIAIGAAVPTDNDEGFAKGCLFIQTDGTDQTDTLHCNIGDADDCNFNVVTVAAD